MTVQELLQVSLHLMHVVISEQVLNSEQVLQEAEVLTLCGGMQLTTASLPATLSQCMAVWGRQSG